MVTAIVLINCEREPGRDEQADAAEKAMKQLAKQIFSLLAAQLPDRWRVRKPLRLSHDGSKDRRGLIAANSAAS